MEHALYFSPNTENYYFDLFILFFAVQNLKFENRVDKCFVFLDLRLPIQLDLNDISSVERGLLEVVCVSS